MRGLIKEHLQRRVILLIGLNTLAAVAVLGISSFLAVRESIDRALGERLLLAQSTAAHLERTMEQSLRRLGEVAYAPGLDLEDGDLEPEKRALHEVYFQTLFKEDVFITNREGIVLWSEPFNPRWVGFDASRYSHVKESLATGRAVISSMLYQIPSGKPMVAAVIPLKSREGRLVGLVGGDIDLAGGGLEDLIKPFRLGKTGYIEVVDSGGIVLASTNPEHILAESDHGDTLAKLIRGRQSTVSQCHSCHQASPEQQKRTEVMAFAPLTTIPWGVTVRQLESEALAPAQGMLQRFIFFAIALFLLAVVLATGIARSVVRPIRVLITASQRIASGNLTEPIPPLGDDEIGQLAESFDSMRAKLRGSLERIQEWNRELERSVQERTRELEEARVAQEELLRKVISAQEEERKRIARELHDETSQALAALTMALDATLASGDEEQKKAKLAGMKVLALQTLEGVHRMIFDLRPSLLDDLGLLPALRWYAESRLSPLGVKVHLEIPEADRRLPPQMETVLFRIAQEAITNICKHAHASNAMISVEFQDSHLLMEIEDDGQGFDVAEMSRAQDITRGLGLVGMRERTALLGGSATIQSELGSGTRVAIWVPLLEENSHG